MRVSYAATDARLGVRTRKDKQGVDLTSDVLPFGRLWYDEPNAVGNAIGYAEHYSRSQDAVIRVHDEAGNVIETRARGRVQRTASGAKQKATTRRSVMAFCLKCARGFRDC